MDVISDKSVKTRKAHHCFACCRRFEKGTTMQTQVNTFDGIQRIYTCGTCQELMLQFHDLFFDPDECVFPGECVSEYISESAYAREREITSPEELLIFLIPMEKP